MVRIKSGQDKNEIYALKRCDLEDKREDNLRILREVITYMRLHSIGMTIFRSHWIEYDERNIAKLILNLLMELAYEILRN